MSVNSVVIRKGKPILVSSEHILNCAKGINCQLRSVDGGDTIFQGRGKLYVTNYRLIFVKTMPTEIFSSCTIPYAKFIAYKLKKPLFSPNSFAGECQNINDGGISGITAKFAFDFNDSKTAKMFHAVKVQTYKYEIVF